MISAMLNDPLSTAGAIFGAICLISWPLFQTRSAMLTVQLGVGVGFGLHYALLGATTAAVANILGSLQIVVSIPAGNTPRLRWAGYAFIPAMLLISVATWDGLPSLFAAFGTVMLAFGRMQSDENRLRLLVLAGTAFWFLHDLMLRSPLAFVDAVSLGLGLYSFFNWELGRRRRVSFRCRRDPRAHRSSSFSRFFEREKEFGAQAIGPSSSILSIIGDLPKSTANFLDVPVLKYKILSLIGRLRCVCGRKTRRL